MTKDQDVAVLRAEIAERIEEAWDTLRRMPDPERDLLRRSERGQQWPPMIHEAAEHAAWKPGKLQRPMPTSKQIDRMHEVMDWMLALSKQDRGFGKAVWLMCALRKKPGEAAKVLGVYRETARIWRDNGLDRIVASFRLRRAA